MGGRQGRYLRQDRDDLCSQRVLHPCAGRHVPVARRRQPRADRKRDDLHRREGGQLLL